MSPLPYVVEWLLCIGLPADQREPIAGDLEEEFATRARHSGPARATWDIWWLALRIACTFRWESWFHGRPLPPVADKIPRRVSVFERIAQDASFALRMLRRQPAFTAIATLMLTLGIGANTAIFSIVDSVLWRPLPYPDGDRVMSLAEQRPLQGLLFGDVSPADFFDWRRESRSFSAVAGLMETAMNLTGSGEPERLRGLSVSSGFLDVLQVMPVQGRGFRTEEEIDGQNQVVMITDGLWRRRFNAEPGVVGRRIMFDGDPYEVVGVLPPTFWWRTQPDVLVPLALTDHDRTLRAAHFLEVVARLKPGVTEIQARDELNRLGTRLSQMYPAENQNHGPNLQPLRRALVGDVRTSLLVLLGAVGFVLLIACANVATLLLARAAGRRRELSIRTAVGASRARLIQQMVTESLVVSFIGGAAGVFLATWILAFFRVALPAQFSQLPGVQGLTIDLRVLAVAFGLSLFTGLIFGTVPAVVASDQPAGVALNEESRGTSGARSTRRLRSGLVMAEVALSLMLLVGAALLIVSFRKLTSVEPGFRPEQLITVRLTLPWSRYGEHQRAVAFYDGVFERLRATPGVVSVAASSAPPFIGIDARLDLNIERRTAESPEPVRAHPRLVSAGYFRTMGIPVMGGRDFTERDNDSAPAVAIINDTAARRYWPNENPIGQRISLGEPTRWMEIVGIVGNIRHQGLDEDWEPEAYIPHRQNFTALGMSLERKLTLLVRTTSDVATIGPVIRNAVKSVDADQPLGVLRQMDGLIADSVAPRRFSFLLVSAFALLAVILTAAGLYGVMSYVVAQRTREIGIRMALGASSKEVVGLVMREGTIVTVAGIAIGAGGALLLSRAMKSMLFEVSAADPAIYVGVSVLLAAVALLGVAIPSSRAARVDPVIALRDP